MNFEGFSAVDFPPINREVPGFVYIFCWIAGSEEVPFYVGQTTRIWGRLDDYYWAMFSACADFRVGEAIRYLGMRGYRVVVKYKPSTEPRVEERKLIEDLRPPLNRLSGFNFQTANEADERLRVHQFLDTLLSVHE